MKKYIVSLLVLAASFGFFSQTTIHATEATGAAASQTQSQAISTANRIPQAARARAAAQSVEPRTYFNTNPEVIFPGIHAIYPVTAANVPTLTQAPEGYTPYYLFYYGRHGSRFDMRKTAGQTAIETLKAADKKGKLTAEGKQILAHIEEIVAFCDGRQGTLSRLGQSELEAIAHRMYYNFPELFWSAKKTNLEAESSEVHRCIVSMASFVSELRSLNSAIHVEMDSSPYCMRYMKPGYVDTAPRKNMESIINKYVKAHPYETEDVVKTLFESDYKVKNANNLVDALARLAAFGKSSGYESEDLIALVGRDNLFNYWSIDNVTHYYHMGQCSEYQDIVIGQMHNAVKKMIEYCDDPQGLTANLWFSHDSFLYPFAALININGFDTKAVDADHVNEVYKGNANIPLASNFQLILYRNTEGRVLCKILYNESEATLPIKSVTGPYYDWQAVKAYLQSRLSLYPMYKD